MDKGTSGSLAACDGTRWDRVWAFFPRLPLESLTPNISTSTKPIHFASAWDHSHSQASKK